MKKFIAVILTTVMLFSNVIVLVGCEQNESQTLSIGQWLNMINTTFGMNSYTTDKPYLKTVNGNDEYFRTVQIAVEWQVIDKDSDINPRDTLKWKDALVTLVNVGGFTDIEATDDEKIQYATENFGEEIRSYWMERDIEVEKASVLLETAHKLWVNKKYDEKVENVDFADNVVDLSTEETEIPYEVTDEGLVFDEEDAMELAEGDVLVLPESAEVSPSSGGGYSSGSTAGNSASDENNNDSNNNYDSNNNQNSDAEDNKNGDNDDKDTENDSDIQIEGFKDIPNSYKISNIETKDGKVIVELSDDLELGDVVDELKVEDSYVPDLTKATIYDGNGNIVQTGVTSSLQNDGTPMLSTMSTSQVNSPNLQKTAKTTFTINGCDVALEISKDKVKAGIEVPLNEDLDTYYEMSIEDFNITNEIDFSWGKLHSAQVKVDYKTSQTMGVKTEAELTEKTYAPKWSNGNGKFLTNLKRSVWKDTSSKGAKSIKIASIDVASVGVAKLSLDIRFKITADGSIELTCTETGCKGIEYKNKNCRVINTSSRDIDYNVKAKLEGTLSIGPTINAFGFAIIGAKGEFGVGIERTETLHLADAENHLLEEIDFSDISSASLESTNVVGLKADASEIATYAKTKGGIYEAEEGAVVDLKLDRCSDISLYFILKISVEEETLAGDLLKGLKINAEWEILGSDNAKIGSVHFENGKRIGIGLGNEELCTLKYEPFDGVEEATEESTSPTETEDATDNEVRVGEILSVSSMKSILSPKETTNVQVSQIPEGYKVSDLVYKSNNTDVATVDASGVITAVEQGSTMILISTSDGKYSCACSVTVTGDYDTTFTPLDYNNYAYAYEGEMVAV